MPRPVTPITPIRTCCMVTSHEKFPGQATFWPRKYLPDVVEDLTVEYTVRQKVFLNGALSFTDMAGATGADFTRLRFKHRRCLMFPFELDAWFEDRG